MTFEELLDQAVAMLQRRGRVTYRALQLQFKLDDETLEALKEEILYSQLQVVDDEGRGLVWTGEAGAPPEPMSIPSQLAQPGVTHEAQPDQANPLPPEPPTPDAERRQLTVMFCDLVGSTPLSEQLDPEDLREVVRAYQQTCAEVVQRFDGHIAQLLGDALLVYFGWPQAHEDDAQRAVRTGLGMLDAMNTLNMRLEQDKGIRLAIRVGIHTGLVVVGEMGGGGHQEQLALGEAPNVAARLQGLAEPDTVVMSAGTFRLVQGFFDCQDLNLQSLKGVATPVQVYRVVSESGAQSRLDVATTRGLTPLVGREQEVGLLVERWGQVMDGMGQVVLLGGEAGIGKSRLVQVLKEHVANTPHFRWECRGSPYFRNSALYPLIDLFQRAFRFEQNDAPRDKLRKMEHVLTPYVSLPEVLPLFASLLSLPLDDQYPPLTLTPERQRQKTLEAVLHLLLAVAARKPVLLIMEDLHWADPSTLELCELLIDQTPTARLLALLTCRPEFQPTWSHRSYLTEITLNRLSRAQIERMAERVAGGKRLPSEVLEQIIDKADGVPLFVEEMTKAVLESGVLKAEKGQYERVGSLSDLAIPATLHDSLMARLDRLMTAKVIAQLGATIGRTFSYDLLHAVARIDQPTLQRELRRLVAAELLYQRGLVPQATYTFKHALIQDVAYQSLLKSTRQQYHQRIAEAILTHYGNDLEAWISALAYHFTHGGNLAKALPYAIQTGEQAQRIYANVEALHAFTQALEILDALPSTEDTRRRRTDLTLRLAALHALLGHYRESLSLYAHALEAVEAAEDPGAIARLETRIGRVRYSTGDHEGAMACFQRALDLAQRLHDTTRMAVCYQSLGDVYFTSGSLPKAIECFMQALQISEAAGHQAGVAAACTFLCNAHGRAGNLAEAVQWGRRALQLGEQLHDDRRIAWACIMLAQAYYLSGEFTEGEALRERALPLFEKVGDFRGIAWARGFRSYFEAAEKHFEKALEYANNWIQMGKASGGFQHEVSAASARAAEWLLCLGRYREAFEYCHQSLSISLKTSNKLEYGKAYWVLAEIHASEAYQDWDKAAWYLEESLKALREAGARVDVGVAHLAGARIALLRQDGSARRWAETARDIFAEWGAKALLREAEELLEELTEDSS